MTLLAPTAALIGAGVFLWAGLDKARNMTATISTLRQLGMSEAASRATTIVVVASEIVVAVALVLRPDSYWTQSGVVVLAGGFAVAGIVAIRKDEPIRCTCFGSTGDSYLGSRQVIALLPWIAGVALLHLADISPPSGEGAATALAGLGLFMASMRLWPMQRAWREARGDRRAAQEMYVWLHR